MDLSFADLEVRDGSERLYPAPVLGSWAQPPGRWGLGLLRLIHPKTKERESLVDTDRTNACAAPQVMVAEERPLKPRSSRIE